jgi:hypothetical protein
MNAIRRIPHALLFSTYNNNNNINNINNNNKNQIVFILFVDLCVDILVFRYKHIGGYEYVGSEDGFVERGSKSESIVTGLGAFWLWRAVYYRSVHLLLFRFLSFTYRFFFTKLI